MYLLCYHYAGVTLPRLPPPRGNGERSIRVEIDVAALVLVDAIGYHRNVPPPFAHTRYEGECRCAVVDHRVILIALKLY